ncbi:MAG: hypothetical protein NVS4B11_00480 [Ktedonobacteraceae bacterium]
MLKSILGIRLLLQIGKDITKPAPYEVMKALVRVEVTDEADDIDGFQMTFTLGKDKNQLKDYNLLQNGTFDPGSRVTIAVFLTGAPEIIMDGVITHHQLMPSNEPGKFTFTVMGKDVSLKLDLHERNNVYKHLTDSQIVENVLGDYADILTTEVTSTSDADDENTRVTRQYGSDLKFIQMLAVRNGYVFYINPDTSSASKAYWGPENRKKKLQPALTMNMGSYTNVTSLSFSHDAFVPATVEDSYILDPDSKRISKVSQPSSNLKPLASRPTQTMRTIILRTTANRNSSLASRDATSATVNTPRSVTGQGEFDTARYGYILHAGELVGVRGVGASYNGGYYVQRVIHSIEAGKYTQSFSLSREGVGALQEKVSI